MHGLHQASYCESLHSPGTWHFQFPSVGLQQGRAVLLVKVTLLTSAFQGAMKESGRRTIISTYCCFVLETRSRWQGAMEGPDKV